MTNGVSSGSPVDLGSTRAAWDRLVESGELDGSGLRDHVHRAWARCQAHRVDPRTMQPQRLTPADTAALLEAKRDLIEAAGPYLRALSLAAGSERHAAMLGDEGAVVLDIVGDEETVHRTEGFPVPGTLLSEALAGGNGIGTPLCEAGYVELVGPEHFIEGFQVYTCQGLPLRGPDGDVVGVLSISVRRVEAAARLHEILICAAHGVEAELTHRRLQLDLLDAIRQRGGDLDPLELLRQDVTQLHAASRLRLERAARTAIDRPEGVLGLVLEAQELSRRYLRSSQLWREIAFDTCSAAQPVDLQARLVEVAGLSATEAAARGVRLRVLPHPSVVAQTDSRSLSRSLFRVVLRALELSAPGAEVELQLCAAATAGHVEVVVSTPAAAPVTFPVLIGLPTSPAPGDDGG